MGDKFLRIVDDGTGPVALFEREQEVGAGDRMFALRRDLLRARAGRAAAAVAGYDRGGAGAHRTRPRARRGRPLRSNLR